MEELKVHDIRNKLSPITILLSMLDDERCKELIPDQIEKVKKSVNYLAQRDVYKEIKTNETNR